LVNITVDSSITGSMKLQSLGMGNGEQMTDQLGILVGKEHRTGRKRPETLLYIL